MFLETHGAGNDRETGQKRWDLVISKLIAWTKSTYIVSRLRRVCGDEEHAAETRHPVT